MLSFEEALRVAGEFAQEIDGLYPGKIEAVFAIGSLGSDYYRPGQSDIDTVLITRFSRAEVEGVIEQVERIADTYQARYQVPKGFGAIVFAKEQLFAPYVHEEELVQEILRLKTQSRLVWGEYDLSAVPMPDWDAIGEDIRHFQEWVDSQPPFNYSLTAFVNSTLIALKRYLLLKHHIIEFNKFKVIDLYLRHDPPMVNQEIFDFIENHLHNVPVTWEEPMRNACIQWHDELYGEINRLVLQDRSQ